MIEVVDKQDIWPYTLYRKKYKSKKFELKNNASKIPLFCLKSISDNSNLVHQAVSFWTGLSLVANSENVRKNG